MLSPLCGCNIYGWVASDAAVAGAVRMKYSTHRLAGRRPSSSAMRANSGCFMTARLPFSSNGPRERTRLGIALIRRRAARNSPVFVRTERECVGRDRARVSATPGRIARCSSERARCFRLGGSPQIIWLASPPRRWVARGAMRRKLMATRRLAAALPRPSPLAPVARQRSRRRRPEQPRRGGHPAAGGAQGSVFGRGQGGLARRRDRALRLARDSTAGAAFRGPVGGVEKSRWRATRGRCWSRELPNWCRPARSSSARGRASTFRPRPRVPWRWSCCLRRRRPASWRTAASLGGVHGQRRRSWSPPRVIPRIGTTVQPSTIVRAASPKPSSSSSPSARATRSRSRPPTCSALRGVGPPMPSLPSACRPS